MLSVETEKFEHGAPTNMKGLPFSGKFSDRYTQNVILVDHLLFGICKCFIKASSTLLEFQSRRSQATL